MSITLIIIVVTVLASLYAWNNASIMQKWIMNPYAVNTRKEYYRFVTSGLIHNDYTHLFFNMLTLYFFGEAIERVYKSLFGLTLGSVLYVIFYVVAVIVSDIPTYMKHKNQPHYNSLGASGGVSGVLFASILFFPLNSVCVFFALCIPGFIFGILYMMYSYYMAERGGDNINHDAHIYGAVFGVVFTIIIAPVVLSSFPQQILDWVQQILT